ncbi:MAG TPA: hypothetical protein VEI04_05980 [Syntrophobacteria bacterium]|nr:hypothetical protein [Syntrophobacteria bacterium]
MTILRYVAGIIFLILGVIGLFLPILQGILFILIGLALVFPRNRYVEKLIAWARNRWPNQATRMDAWNDRLRVFLPRLGGKGGDCQE